MFVKSCPNPNTHEKHEHLVHWQKKELPMLLHPERYPEEWDTKYQCPGLSVEAWNVHYLHEDCTPCEACADMAVEASRQNGTESEVWRELGVDDVILHMAEVTRV